MISDISMMLRKLILCFFVMYALSIKGQGSSICTVIDAETGEPLSFVQIYIADGRGALTNDEGRFSIEAHPSEVLIITCMGYQRMRIKAGNLPRVLKLTPSVTELKEVTVYSPQNILQQVINGMERDYNVYKKVSASYYMRQTYTMSGAMQMAEAYLQAACANNLRNVEFVAGRMFHGMNGGRKLSLDLSNIHATLSLAPMIKGESFWRGAVVPLNRKTFHKRYNYEKDPNSENDFGNNIIPNLLRDNRKMYAYHFNGYWKDVGTIPSLWEANMEVLDPEHSGINLFDENWKIYSRNSEMTGHRIGADAIVEESMVTDGCNIQGTVKHSVLFSGVTVEKGAVVEDAVVMSFTSL